MAVLIQPDGTETQVAMPATYEEAQKLLGGYVERVRPRYGSGKLFLCDEEGLLKGLALNTVGSALYGTFEHGQPIVGPILLFDPKEPGAEEWA